MKSFKSDITWGLALGGGGARGIIHVGVLKALEEAGIKPVCIAGTSIGAIVGGFYASGMSPDDLLAHFRNQSWIKMFRLRASFSSFLEMKYLHLLLDEKLSHNFEDLQIPFYACVTNLSTRSSEVFHSGDLHSAITASASIPILFPPVEINGVKYVDGGVTNNIPSAALVGHCDKILAVDVNNIPPAGKLDNVKDIALEIFHTAIDNNSREGREAADAVIRPELGREFDILDFSKTELLFGIGYRAGCDWINTMELEEGEMTKEPLVASAEKRN